MRRQARYTKAELIQTLPDTGLKITHLQKCLQNLLEKSQALEDAYSLAAEKVDRSGQPWKVVVCWDEFVPGAQLTGRHDRKFMHLAMNFMDLGTNVLCLGKSWITLMCVSTALSYDLRFVCSIRFANMRKAQCIVSAWRFVLCHPRFANMREAQCIISSCCLCCVTQG